jgi:tRNA nucleotidyltransferase/poly(A) polymerase
MALIVKQYGLKQIPDWLCSEETLRLVNLLQSAQIALRFMGGTVRDTMIGRKPNDVDCVIMAPKAQLIALLKQHKIDYDDLTDTELTKITINNRKYDVVSALDGFGLDNIDVSGWRNDRLWQETARKIDFTINAMQMTSDGTIYDYFNSYPDLMDGRLRFTCGFHGDALIKIIRNDCRRILRLMRLHAYYGKVAVDEETMHAIRAAVDTLIEAPSAYVQYELNLTLKAPHPLMSLQSYHHYGVLEYILGFNINSLEHLTQLLKLEKELRVFCPGMIRLLSLLAACKGSDMQGAFTLFEKHLSIDGNTREIMNGMLESFLILRKNPLAELTIPLNQKQRAQLLLLSAACDAAEKQTSNISLDQIRQLLH